MSKVHDILRKHIPMEGLHHVIDLEKSEGAWLVDKTNGRKYLDCFSQFASMPLGYNHPKFKARINETLPAVLCKTVNSDLYSDEYAAFVDRLYQTVIPGGFDYCFFIEGGSAAVENALKVAFDWKADRLGLKDSFAQQLDIVHFKQAFHGRGGYTLSLTNTGASKTDRFPRFKWTRVDNPHLTFPPTDSKSKQTKLKQAEDASLEQITQAMLRGNVAAVIIEPLQSEGGNNIFTYRFLNEIRKLCTRYESLLIFDEVQTGFGASGKWWLWQDYDIRPDIVSFGKKSQVCGIYAHKATLDKVLHHCFNTPGRISSTWGGNLIDMIRSKIMIEIIEEDNLLNNVIETSKYLKNGLVVISKEHKMMSNVRGIGSLIAFDLPDEPTRNKILAKLREDMVILPCGNASIRFRTALDFTKENADEALKIVEKVISEYGKSE